MPMGTQTKLLRVLEDSKARRLGGKAEFEVDVRVVATSNRELDEVVREGRFREDLYYRLNVFHVCMPPLRDRREDISAIAHNLIPDLNRKHHCKVTHVLPEAIEALMRYDWPGNVLELCNAIERSAILAAQGAIQTRHLPINLQEHAAPFRHSTGAVLSNEPRGMLDGALMRVMIGTTVEEVERDLILLTLQQMQNDRARAAAVLGISPKTLLSKLKEYGAA
jgi:DNA-binding NtrC family response regulator